MASSVSETVAAACITDLGNLPADYGSRDRLVTLNPACPSAFVQFTLPGDADVRLSATGGAGIYPSVAVRDGGLGADVGLRSGSANSASLPVVYYAGDASYTVEVFSTRALLPGENRVLLTLEFEPALRMCDTSLGSLSSEELVLFGKYNPDCGDTRKYYFYVEYPASVAASIVGSGFTPRRRTAAPPEPATPSRPSPPIREIRRTSIRRCRRARFASTWKPWTMTAPTEMSLQPFGLPPPTRTPIPTPTPRLAPNQDVRIEPNPAGGAYDAERLRSHTFTVIGNPGAFPLTDSVRRRLCASSRPTHYDTHLRWAAVPPRPTLYAEKKPVANSQPLRRLTCTCAAATTRVGARSRWCGIPTTACWRRTASISTHQPRPPRRRRCRRRRTTRGGPTDQVGLGDLINYACDAAGMNCQVYLIVDGLAVPPHTRG